MSEELRDELLAAGYTDLTLLDVSARALEEVAARLGERTAGVTFVTATSTSSGMSPTRAYDGIPATASAVGFTTYTLPA